MKISEAIIKLETATAHIKGKGIKVREIHGDVREAVKSVAEGMGLEARTWELTIPDEYGRHNTIINYGADFTEDKRYKNDRVGHLHKVTFAPAQDFISMDDTVQEAIHKLQYNNAKLNYERLQNELADLQKQVEEYKGYVTSVGAEMIELGKKIKHDIKL